MSDDVSGNEAEYQRRIDRILADDYLGDLSERPTDEIRRMRDECEEEESGISYARRVLQGRLDILRAEARRRRESEGESVEELLAMLPAALADDDHTSSPVDARPMRHLVPPAVKYHRREVDRIADDQSLSDIRRRSLDELAEITEALSEKEQEFSRIRQQLFHRIDRLQDELISRYKSGSTDVNELLARGT